MINISPNEWTCALEFVARYVFAIYIRKRWPRDDAEDLVQNVMMKMIRSIDRFDPSRGSLKQWATGFVRNEVWEFDRIHRRNTNYVEFDTQELPDRASHYVATMSDGEQEDRLERLWASAKLTDLEMPVVEELLEGIDEDMMAARRKCTQSNVNHMKSRIFKKCRESLAGQEMIEEGLPGQTKPPRKTRTRKDEVVATSAADPGKDPYDATPG